MFLRVDVATGETVYHAVDLQLPGAIPVELARAYRSGQAQEAGLFGAGWRSSLEVALEVGHEAITFRQAGRRPTVFTPIDVGVQAVHAETGLVLQHHPDAYVVFRSPRARYVFPKSQGRGGTLYPERIEDPYGNHVQFVYAGTRPLRLIDAEGRQVHFSYDGNRIAAVQVTDGREVVRRRTYRYDFHGDLVAVEDGAGRVWRFEYQSHLLVACTDRLGGRQYAQYDADRRCIAIWQADGSAVRHLAYDEVRQATLVLDTGGYQTIYQHAAPDCVLGRVDPESREQFFYYDEQGGLAGFSGEGGRVITFQRWNREERTFTRVDDETSFLLLQLDGQGLATEAEDAYGHRYGYTYDAQGGLVRFTLPSGVAWTFERDRQGRLVQVLSPEGRRVRLAYGRDGRTRTVADDLGERFSARYDLLGRLVERVDASGRRQQRQYDSEGRLTGLAVGGYRLQFTYDAEGHLLAVADSEGRRAAFRYDAFGRMRTWTDPEGRQGQVEYDRDGHVVRMVDGQGRVLDARPGREAVPPAPDVAFGPSGELRVAVRGDETLLFHYDPDGRLVQLQGDDRAVSFSYDGDGNLQAVEDAAGRRIRLAYDPRGRLVRVTDPAGRDLHLAYDDDDRLASLQRPGGERLVFRYDALDRLVERTGASGDETHTFRFGDAPPRSLCTTELDLPAAATDSGDGGTVWASLVQGRYGLVWLAAFGPWWIPVWWQDAACDGGGTTDAMGRLAAWCLEGPDAPRTCAGHRSAGDVLRWWQRAARPSDPFDLPAVPDLRAPLWMAAELSRFLLRRSCYDVHHPQDAPFFLPRPREDSLRSPDPLVTGAHRYGYLKPGGWSRAHPAGLLRNGQPPVELVLQPLGG
ncbi:hypothetical protein GQ464_010400 [Rhodocaloribacter litoris]|uniref:DUF6531 domain-containing protein n=1 Tax=Rhodocaloribacter litoris TaxID=2558931 RepID=UPI00141ED2E0|nr:DUF6531 domain-containing protein [Rhodocaloribacter litoris]QXD13880.1 hypothetical protein GQ464_010400 [Rhodocaloribacter litoris]